MKTLSFLLMLFLSSCVSKSMLQPQYGGNDFATVNISSKFPIAAGYVEIDGDPVDEISCKELTSIKVEPGKHLVIVKDGPGHLNATKKIRNYNP